MLVNSLEGLVERGKQAQDEGVKELLRSAYWYAKEFVEQGKDPAEAIEEYHKSLYKDIQGGLKFVHVETGEYKRNLQWENKTVKALKLLEN